MDDLSTRGGFPQSAKINSVNISTKCIYVIYLANEQANQGTSKDRRGKGWFKITNLFGILEAFDINKFEKKTAENGSLLGILFSYREFKSQCIRL